jgi:hypothetical protein
MRSKVLKINRLRIKNGVWRVCAGDTRFFRAVSVHGTTDYRKR